MTARPVLRHLVACPVCALQYDASGRKPGSRFRCACGEVATVPEPRPHEAAVVRCSACGGPRQGSAPACGFCGSDFTLHEQDLHTICPRCTTRISDRGRFCHACGVAIAPQARAGSATPHPCPACGADRRLSSRSLGEEDLAILECGRCAGLWLGAEAFALLERRARERHADPAPTTTPPRQQSARERPVYRPCPICGELMHRRNYGRKSGVIVDTCRRDGIWFDADELDSVLRWIRRGGPAHAAEERAREREQLDRQRRLYAPPPEPETSPPAMSGPLFELIRSILDAV